MNVKQQGYLIARNFIPPIAIAQFKMWAMNPDNIHRGNAMDGKYYAHHDGEREYNVWWTTCPPMEMWLPIEYMLSSRIDLFFDGAPWSTHVVDCITTKPGSQKIYAHIDNPYKWDEFKDSDETLGIQIIIPLDEFTIDNGATAVWLGSHAKKFQDADIKANQQHYNDTLLSNGSQFVALPGDVLMYHGRTLHSTMPNNSHDFRSALLINVLRRDIIEKANKLNKNADLIYGR